MAALPDVTTWTNYGVNAIWLDDFDANNEYGCPYSQVTTYPSTTTWTPNIYQRGCMFEKRGTSGVADTFQIVGRNADGAVMTSPDLFTVGNNLSGMTAGQVPIAATASTVTSSKPIAGSGAGVATGPTTSVPSNCTQFADAYGTISDSGSPCAGGSGQIIEQAFVENSAGLVGGAPGVISPATSATVAVQNPTATTPLMSAATSAATNNYAAGWVDSNAPATWGARNPQLKAVIAYGVTGDYSSNSLQWIGFISHGCPETTMSASATPACSYAAIRWNSATDTNYMCVNDNGSGAPTVTSIGVAPAAATTSYGLTVSMASTGVTCCVGSTCVTNGTTKLPTLAHLFDVMVINGYPGGGVTHLWSGIWTVRDLLGTPSLP
jgi:hypothetical protein